MTTQPKFHWQFNEKEGPIHVDTISGVKIKGHRSKPNRGIGRIGHATSLPHFDSRFNFGKNVGQFGTNDFTIAFGIKVNNTRNENDMDLIGSRSVGGHGNWVSLRLESRGRILNFEVDENNKGKHYVRARTGRLPVSNKKWHHIALVREGKTIKVYFDGAKVAQGASKTGVANIKNNTDFKLGHWTRNTPSSFYEDLRIYHAALDANQVAALVPAANRPLGEGQIELVAPDNAGIIIEQDVADLIRLSFSFKQLRVGPGTGITLYQNRAFGGVSQKIYTDIPDLRLSKLKKSPGSVRIWPSADEPFTGSWIINAPDGNLLSSRIGTLTTTGKQTSAELFKFHYNLKLARLQLLPGSEQENGYFKIGADSNLTNLFVEDPQLLDNEFFITNPLNNRWLILHEDGTFGWTKKIEDRAAFLRLVKIAEHEGQVGALMAGEVALYQNIAYHGKTWVFAEGPNEGAGSFKNFLTFEGLNDQTSSIRLGPDTGVTLFKHANHKAAENRREEEIEDIVESVPDLRESQIGDDSLSSLKIFKSVRPEKLFTSVTSKLSQDYRMVGDKLEEFSSYRTILRFKQGDSDTAGLTRREVEVSATDLTTIEVGGVTHEIDEVRAVTLSSNEMNHIMITSEADGLDTPGLKIRSREMAPNEQVVIFPNQEAHRKISQLEDGALWNAKDAAGNLIVDRKAHTQAEVASVQNTIKRTMAAVIYAEGDPESTKSGQSGRLSSDQIVSGENLGNPWELKLKPADSETDNGNGSSSGPNGGTPPTFGLVAGPTLIEESEISSDEWNRLLNEATTIVDETPFQAAASAEALGGGNLLAARAFRPFRRIKNAVKKAFSVVVGAVKNVVHVIVKTAEGVFDFIIDTAKKVADFVEAVVEKVVEGIKKFIEFLQFLFNWGDILDTQKFLVKMINSGFDSASALVASAKPHVAEFADTLRDGVNEQTDSLLKKIGVDPEKEKQGTGLPEAAEWFLDKLFGNSKSSKAKTTPDSLPNAGDVDGDTPLERALRHFLEALKASSLVGVEVFDGMIGTIEALITNPLRPELALAEIIDTCRDVVIRLLDLGENLVLGFLEVIVGMIELFQDLINFEMRIPFISDLFKLIGAGKLTVLNLAALIIAIPATVLSKLIFGKAPVQGVIEPEFPNQAPAQIGGQRDLVLSVEESTATIDNAKTKKKVEDFGKLALGATATEYTLGAALDFIEVIAKEDVPRGRTFWVEAATLLAGGISWLGSFPPSKIEPGGYPYNIAHPKHRVSGNPDLKHEFFARLLWGYRTFVFGVEIIYFVVATKFPDMQLEKTRIRRADSNVKKFATGLAAIDLILTIIYAAHIPRDEKLIGLEVTSEIMPIMPNLTCLMMESKDKRVAGIPVALSVIAFGVGFGGIRLLNRDIDALDPE
jgi:hypothetical protein